MSDFEFISVILSIVVALAITRILSGLASLIELRGELRLHGLTLGWAVLILLWQAVYWFAVVNSWRSREVWTFGNFGILFLMGIVLYVAAALVLPRRIGPETSLAQHYHKVRRPLFAVFAVMPPLDLIDSLFGASRTSWRWGRESGSVTRSRPASACSASSRRVSACTP